MYNKFLLPYAKKLRKSQTDAENKLWYYLRAKRFSNIKLYRQYPIEKYIVDFISIDKKLIIEIDGGQHNESEKIKSDSDRTSFLKSKGFSVMRFWNNEVLNNIDGVLEAINNNFTSL